MVGRSRTIFLKDLRGFVSPVALRISFTFDFKLGYAFIGTFIPLTTINSVTANAEESVKISVNEALLFLTDEDNVITEISENVLEACGFDGD